MTFGIRGNINKPGFSKVAYGLIKELQKRKIDFIVDSQIAQAIKTQLKKTVPAGITASNSSLIKQIDFIVSIGGDGTFLSTAKLVGRRGIPIIGVNMGKLGFLAETSVDQTAGFIYDITKGKYNIEERTVLQAKTRKSDKTIYGMNEIVINQGGMVKTVEFEVLYNNQRVNCYHADGIIVSTPSGSTGYSLSAGGPIVYPKTEVFILTALAPHTLTARPVILPDTGEFKIHVKSRIPINAVADGASSISLKLPAEIIIKKAPYTVKVAKSLRSNYFKVLTTKLLWGIDKRKNKQ
jgi:NAD+ kinase